jgi:carbonic anhydrase
MNSSICSIVLASSLLSAAIVPANAQDSATKSSANIMPGKSDPRRASPEAALAALKSGNSRFSAGASRSEYDKLERIAATTAHQHPIACVFACADSRTPPEAIFDLGIGELFVCRVAGVASGNNDLASLEYGTAVLGAPLIVVMAHNNCGAMKAAIANKPLPGSLPKLVAQIRPAVKRAELENPKADPAKLLDAATRQQVQAEICHLMESPVIRKQTKEGKLKVVGAIYNIHDGTILWL